MPGLLFSVPRLTVPVRMRPGVASLGSLSSAGGPRYSAADASVHSVNSLTCSPPEMASARLAYTGTDSGVSSFLSTTSGRSRNLSSTVASVCRSATRIVKSPAPTFTAWGERWGWGG